MEQRIYLILAVAGVSVVLIQVVLQVVGIVGDEVGGDADFSGHGDGDMGVHTDGDGDGHGEIGHGNWFTGLLSLKALSAFVGVFGLTGMALLGNPAFSAASRVALSAVAGFIAMWAVALLMRALSGLHHSGTVNLRHAVGQKGRVYLRIPGGNQGMGKVIVEVEGRQIHLRAVTEGDNLATGVQVRVLELLADETIRVILSVPEEQEVSN